jgi:hypothetical protein
MTPISLPALQALYEKAQGGDVGSLQPLQHAMHAAFPTLRAVVKAAQALHDALDNTERFEAIGEARLDLVDELHAALLPFTTDTPSTTSQEPRK